MLSPRTETILKSIVGQYIISAAPVPSHSISSDYELGVSAATVRNEMAHLEQEGYITRPHPSAGGIPLDKGYRSYVASLGDVQFPVAEQRLVSHLFHQVEQEMEGWLHLAATLTAQKAQNMALVSMPRTEACQFKHLELVSLQDSLVLLVLVLRGAKVRQQLVNFDRIVFQDELTVMANMLNDIYAGLTGSQITDKNSGLTFDQQQITECLLDLMEAEDSQEFQDPYLDGLHFTLNQPELTQNHWLVQTLTELIEQRNLLSSILTSRPTSRGVHVIIGRENKAEAIHDYSVVISQYGLPDGAAGTICVIGPTRMPYARTIATVNYLSLVLSGLVAKLYGGETPGELNPDLAN
ncbi:MAG: heat-inducible transcriptional repressor HrcA [Dehalococcoidales bacterium]|nr:heat-inducible transcriptional repressor HrcA [Dehalococcoidales bacterium]